MKCLKRILVILISIPVAIFLFVTVGLIIVHKNKGIDFSYQNNGSDLMFQSSDGIWVDEEDMLNGKNFEKLLVQFELYKIKCDKPEVTLLRIKAKKKPYKWAWWFDNYSNPKWSIPYHKPLTEPDLISADCVSRPPTPSELAQAEDSASIFITSLVSE